MKGAPIPVSIDEYITGCPPDVQPVLQEIRSLVRSVAPTATERISYRMPAFFLDGVLIYFAAFKNHIGIYPPVRGDDVLNRALAPYRGEKGNLKFPLAQPMPYTLLERVVKARVNELRAKTSAKSR